jgi:NFU1 iron-sulfur cluster scaffold homolog, mitochondrial
MTGRHGAVPPTATPRPATGSGNGPEPPVAPEPLVAPATPEPPAAPAPPVAPAAPAAPALPVHPERTDDPRTLRWVTGTTPLGGAPALEEAAAGPLLRLVADGVLARVDFVGGYLQTRLAEGRTWPDDLATVRAGVRAAVAAAREHLAGTEPGERDALIATAAAEVAADLVTPLASAHGGAMEVTGVCDGVVTVRLHGACHGCPAATNTVQQVFGTELRRRLPGVDGLEIAAEGKRTSPSAWLQLKIKRTFTPGPGPEREP